ncbi:MAG: hypothetical protein EXR48_02645 [Dehalococcoidia bacterium]|nr:hypothetical protein [Dehalococcoidia bacterium]
MRRIDDYYSDKTLLISGVTGLVGKVLIEKLLYDLPQVRRLYVLIRPKGAGVSSETRFTQEVLATPAFNRLRARHGDGFAAFVQQKVVPLSGDLGEELFGLSEAQYRQLQAEVDVVINSAAMVSFDAPLDQALAMNTLATVRVLEFTRGAPKAILAHISTCYVNGTRHGPVPEEPFSPTLTVGLINGRREPPYDVEEEIRAIQSRVALLRSREAAQSIAVPRETVSQAAPARNGSQRDTRSPEEQRLDAQLVAEGFRWAQRRGWNDVYTFTKAMGEQMLVRHRRDVPVLILRPSIIESSLGTPEPGWLDGFRMLDPLIVAYGRERLPDFPGNREGILDIVPVDIVVNAVLATVPWAHDRGGLQIFHVATGMENPLLLPRFAELVQEHFRQRPLTSRANRPQRLPDMTFPSTKAYLRKLFLRHGVPLTLTGALARLIPSARRRRKALRSLDSKRSSLQRLVLYARLYGPYAEARCQYLTHNLRSVWDSLTEEEQQRFNFDMKSIDWANYLKEVHIPGIRKFLLGLPRAPGAEPPVRSAAPPEETEEVSPSAQPTASTQQGEPAGVAPSATRKPAGAAIVAASPEEVKRWIRASPPVFPARSVWRFLLTLSFRWYLHLKVSGLENVPNQGPFIVVSNHCSHLDAGAITAALSSRNRNIHPLAAKDYFFNTTFKSWASHVFLNAAPFDRQSHVGESLGLALGILRYGHPLIFFPEGARSPTGAIQPFKRGIGLLAVESGVPVVPAYIAGSFQAMPKGRALPRPRRVSIRFGRPISAEAASANESPAELARQVTAEIQQAVEALAPGDPGGPA